jgi:hypothetical protein
MTETATRGFVSLLVYDDIEAAQNYLVDVFG